MPNPISEEQRHPPNRGLNMMREFIVFLGGTTADDMYGIVISSYEEMMSLRQRFPVFFFKSLPYHASIEQLMEDCEDCLNDT